MSLRKNEKMQEQEFELFCQETFEELMQYGEPDIGRQICKHTSMDIQETVLQAHLYQTHTQDADLDFFRRSQDAEMWYSALLKLATDMAYQAKTETELSELFRFHVAVQVLFDEVSESLAGQNNSIHN